MGFFEDHGITVEPPESTEAVLPPAPTSTVALPVEIDDHGPMVLVSAGPFLFGPDREPRSLSAFYIDKYPVTNKQYGAFCRATQYRWPKYWTDPRFNGPDQPVVGVSAADAAKYCKWVGKELPTEEQWEKAARGADGRVYPWGDVVPKDGSACYGRDPETGGTDPVTAHEIGAGPYGAQDLAGNAWEWTATTIAGGRAPPGGQGRLLQRHRRPAPQRLPPRGGAEGQVREHRLPLRAQRLTARVT